MYKVELGREYLFKFLALWAAEAVSRKYPNQTITVWKKPSVFDFDSGWDTVATFQNGKDITQEHLAKQRKKAEELEETFARTKSEADKSKEQTPTDSPAEKKIPMDDELHALMAMQGRHSELFLAERKIAKFLESCPSNGNGTCVVIRNAEIKFEIQNPETKRAEFFGICLRDILLPDGSAFPPIKYLDVSGRLTDTEAETLKAAQEACQKIMAQVYLCQNEVAKRIRKIILESGHTITESTTTFGIAKEEESKGEDV